MQQNKRLSLKQLADQPLIFREPGSGIRELIESKFSTKGVRPNVRMVLSNNEAIKHALIGHLGISVLSLHTIFLEGEKGPIALLDVEGFPVERKWHLVYRKGKSLSVIAKSFLKFAREEGSNLSQKLRALSLALESKIR